MMNTWKFHTHIKEIEMKIKTNNQYRDLVSGDELTAEQQREYDYLDGDLGEYLFVVYKGMAFWIGDLSRTEQDGWDGVAGLSAFTAVLFKFSDCGQQVKCGYAYC